MIFFLSFAAFEYYKQNNLQSPSKTLPMRGHQFFVLSKKKKNSFRNIFICMYHKEKISFFSVPLVEGCFLFGAQELPLVAWRKKRSSQSQS